MTRDFASRAWYQPRAADFSCDQHPKAPPKSLINAFALHTGLSQATASHVIDRLRHLSHCIGELETITLYRLQPGDNQTVRPRPSLDSEESA